MAGPRKLLQPYFTEMGLPCPDDIDPADFYVSYLSDPVALWESEVARRRAVDPDYAAPFVPPLTTADMQLYFRASMHRGDWSILRPYNRVCSCVDACPAAPLCDASPDRECLVSIFY